MKRAPTLASIMTPFPHAIESDRGVGAAREMMEQHDFHHLPVIRDGELVGVVAASDVALAGSLDGDVDVQRICATPPYVVDIHTRLVDVVTEMAERRLGSALVTRNDKLVGIVTHTDVSRLLARALHDMSGDAPGDDDVA